MSPLRADEERRLAESPAYVCSGCGGETRYIGATQPTLNERYVAARCQSLKCKGAYRVMEVRRPS